MHVPKTLQEAIKHYADEQVCIDTVAALRWPDGKPHCPECSDEHGKDPYWIATQKRWKCRYCRIQFSVKVGTVFEDSKISLSKWLPALWMICNCKNGISSWELHRGIGVSQKTAWFMLHRLRLSMRPDMFGKMFKFGGEGGPVEVDEAFIGGKIANMHKSKRAKLREIRDAGTGDWNMMNKTAVMGILDRDLRQVRAKVIPSVRREVLQEEILKHVKHGSKLYTDNARFYDAITYKYVHETVTHVEEYVRGQVHTNGIENFWSLLKRKRPNLTALAGRGR